MTAWRGWRTHDSPKGRLHLCLDQNTAGVPQFGQVGSPGPVYNAPRMIRPARLALLCLAGCLPFVPAGAGAADERLCSIKRVEQTASGIKVYFVVRRQIMLMHEQEGDLYWIDAGARESEASG